MTHRGAISQSPDSTCTSKINSFLLSTLRNRTIKARQQQPTPFTSLCSTLTSLQSQQSHYQFLCCVKRLKSLRNMSLLSDLLNLNLSESTDKIIAEYIWIGGSGMDMRSKARTLPGPVSDPSKLPKWNYDGSSTGQAPGEDSEVILYPQAIFKDPFRRGNNILVMCDAYTPAGEPIPTNKRHAAAKIFSHSDVVAEEPWYGIEQEYTLLQKDVKWPLGWPIGGYPGPQVLFVFPILTLQFFDLLQFLLVLDHTTVVLVLTKLGGVTLWTPITRPVYMQESTSVASMEKSCRGSGGAGVSPDWLESLQVGISAGDQLWVARYILERITEIAGVVLSFDPKPIQGDWNGAGAHANYSTKSMRNDGGFEVIKKAIEKLGLRHSEHIAAYGEGNERRLTGKHETADINTFKWGVANRGASIRVGRDTEKEGKGYFEDRRPASNMDPYVVTSMIAETTILWKP
ncbi:hypothetical protein CUMW_076880 [Citrus unshiu]|nr:hypothetical protein CUMW_076880 [Citrus unshiu]